jgi:hypothetical protein
MGSTLLTSNNTKTQHKRRGGGERKIINPIVSYTEAVDFKMNMISLYANFSFVYGFCRGKI